MTMFLASHIRWVGFVVLVLVIAALTTTMVLRHNRAPRRYRRIIGWFYVFLLNVAYGMGSNIADGIRVNLPVFINVGILACLLVAIVWHPQGDDKLPPEDGALGSRFALWLDQRVREYKARKQHRHLVKTSH